MLFLDMFLIDTQGRPINNPSYRCTSEHGSALRESQVANMWSQVQVGMAVPGGPCHGWIIDTDTPASGPQAQYSEVCQALFICVSGVSQA